MHVQDVAYRWLVSPHWRFDVNEEGERWRRHIQFLDLYVERRVHGTNQLRVRLTAERLRRWGRNPEERSSIDPPLVRRAVQYALARGWLPEAPHAPHFLLDAFGQRFLQTPRHLLYDEPLIARAFLGQIQSEGASRATASARIIEPLRVPAGSGPLPPTVTVRVHQPAQHLPEDGVLFLHPSTDPERPGFVDWPRVGGVFRVAGEAVFLYDNSGEEHRWAFLPLQDLRRELVDIHTPPPPPDEEETSAPFEADTAPPIDGPDDDEE